MDKAYLGSISVKVETPDIEFKNREMLREFRRQMRVAHSRGIEEGRDILKRVLDEKGIFDTRKLIRSVASKLFIKSVDVYSGDVHFNNPGKEYAYFVEHGRGPSTKLNEQGYLLLPPKDVITAWANRHGITSKAHIFNIRRYIAEHGTKAQPFMEDAEREIQRNYSDIVDKAVEKYRGTIK